MKEYDVTVAISAQGLVKTYTGRSGEVTAVQGVDLEVQQGEVFGFLGPNGAGKSTCVRMLTTLLSITSGTATVAGVDVTKDPDGVRRKIGVALQEAFPLLFLTPSFVPRNMLTRPMEIAASVNPVTYIMEALRTLVLGDVDWGAVGVGFAVVAALGVVMVVLNVRSINNYD